MGTNYYWQEKSPCPHCRRPYEDLHIGKSSMGWCFSLHVYPDLGINSWVDWKNLLVNGFINDEYGNLYCLQKFISIVEERSEHNDPLSEEFYIINHAVPGPNKLLRHKVDGKHCIGHGRGTYDYIIGDFS